MANGQPSLWPVRWEWVVRSAILATTGLLVFIALDALHTLERIEERVRAVEITMAAKYITRQEVEAMVTAAERRMHQRMDREVPLPFQQGAAP